VLRIGILTRALETQSEGADVDCLTVVLTLVALDGLLQTLSRLGRAVARLVVVVAGFSCLLLAEFMPSQIDVAPAGLYAILTP
jgi:hypothetical protein